MLSNTIASIQETCHSAYSSLKDSAQKTCNSVYTNLTGSAKYTSEKLYSAFDAGVDRVHNMSSKERLVLGTAATTGALAIAYYSSPDYSSLTSWVKDTVANAVNSPNRTEQHYRHMEENSDTQTASKVLDTLILAGAAIYFMVFKKTS